MKHLKLIITFTAGFLFATFSSIAVAQWSEPSEAPPQCSFGSPGCDVPIDNNGNGRFQVIQGDLIVDNLVADNLLPVGIIKLNPQNTNLRSISCTSSSKGFIKYNDQTNRIQFCNGQSWLDL